MQSAAAASHARIPRCAWLADCWRSRVPLRQGLSSYNPVRSAIPACAVFRPQIGKQIANIMTVQTSAD